MTQSTPPAAEQGGAGLEGRLEALGALFEEALERFVAARSAQPIENLHEGLRYALGLDLPAGPGRGKRVRPLLCLLTAEALGADPRRALPFALAIELMHNFALVHDDMEDGDVMRRGRDAAWVRYGAAHGINLGDYLLVQMMAALAEGEPDGLDDATRVRLLRLLTSALDHTHVGQALDINYRHRRSLSEEEYLRIVREKTGYYLAAPIQGGAIVAGASQRVIETIGEMAQYLGPLFQIIDDIIDLTDGKGRESVGSDIREGKRSYLVAYAAQHGAPAQRERLFDILDKPREATTRADIDEAFAIFEALGAVAAGRDYCRRLHEDARRHLERLPRELAEPLGAVIEMLVSRKQ
ncbi:MAG TPA: polyprenyl synthetase family protein [Candidatus Sumerlaeota bacterium]|nr:polyprenyl synthetase family protein [Candidatus Sumerlaeota bacterium]HPK01040.1 polyprenyl synthetase family protein [Candidatus Sumerlaeota bacterium]